MGGRSQPAPQQPSPMDEANARIAVDNATATREATAAERAAAQKKAEDDARRASGVSKINSGYTSGQAWGANKEKSLGYNDSYGLLDSFNQMLGTARTNADPLDTNFADDYDYQSMWDNATKTAQGAQQTKLDNQFRSMTTPGWERGKFADTADDSILDAILNEQYQGAFDTIDTARERGQLSQGGFDNTLRGLNEKRTAGRSTLEDMGLGVLGGYRNELTDIGKTWGDQVTGYKLGQNLDLGGFTSAVDERTNALTGRMKGDIYKAVGDTNLFNTDTLMATGGKAAGVSNNPLRNAFLNPNGELEPERTTGTAGVF